MKDRLTNGMDRGCRQIMERGHGEPASGNTVAARVGIVEQFAQAREKHMSKSHNRTLGRDELIASSYTLSGAPVFEPPRFSFAERVAAAAKAGFAGIGVAIEITPRAVSVGCPTQKCE